MRMPLSSRLLYTTVGVGLPVGAHLADYNATHIFNPRWPPHAKFHGAHTLLTSIMLGGLTAFFAWRPTSDRRTLVLTTSAVASTYFVTQGLAILYPGTAFFDPKFDTPDGYVAGLPAQVPIDVAFLAVTALAAWLALRPNARWADAPPRVVASATADTVLRSPALERS